MTRDMRCGKCVVGLVIVIVMGLLAGCSNDDDPTKDGSAKPKDKPIDVRKGPHTKTLVPAVVRGRAFLLVDMKAEAPSLNGHTSQRQEEYLLKRALMLAAESACKRAMHKEQKDFTVKMILLGSTNEYNEEQWGAAPVLALLKLPRPDLSDEQLDALDDTSLRARFQSIELHTDVLTNTGQ